MNKIEDYPEWLERLENLTDEDVCGIFETCCGVAISSGQYRLTLGDHSADLVVDGKALGFPFDASEKAEKDRQLDAVVEALGGDGWTYDQDDNLIFEGPVETSWCDHDTRNPYPHKQGKD